jgi:uridylate kinase
MGEESVTNQLSGTPKYHRVMLKLGGESLSGENGFGIDPERAVELAKLIKTIKQYDIEVAIVIGAGNLWRGTIGLEAGMERATADYMGMIATVMNAMALQDALERQGIATRVQTAIEMRAVAEPYIRLRAIRHLEKGRVVVMAAGTGNPYFTTDSAGALRAMEINADVLIKATKVDGVYDSDPKADSSATRYKQMSFMEALNMRVGVLDSTALTLCMDNNMPIMVLNLWEENALQRAILGEDVGTLIS